MEAHRDGNGGRDSLECHSALKISVENSVERRNTMDPFTATVSPSKVWPTVHDAMAEGYTTFKFEVQPDGKVAISGTAE